MSSKCERPLALDSANDDTIQCMFFSSELDSDLSSWENLCMELNNSIKNITKDYIWHQDEFQVYAPICKDNVTGLPSHLSSSTCFGDNLEDEWYIVYVIFELSKKFKDIIIQLKDSDGDFLLIEAADFLPTWANPENTENRVFIYNNHIHIIPPEVVTLDTKLQLQPALKVIKDTPQLTQTSNKIHQAIWNRIGKYPDKISENIHKTVVNLPSDLATLLSLKPSLIAPIVTAYCDHDIVDVKCCKKINFSDCVTIEVKFTKFLYAKLMHTKLVPHAKRYVEKENDKKNVLGLKLMCGFQMITNKATECNLNSSKDYIRFVHSLKQNGYFKDNIEGSKEYNSLLEKAQKYFSSVESPFISNVSSSISEILASNDFIRLKKSLESGSSDEQLSYIEDNEDWLNIHPDQLNELLHSRYGKKSKLTNEDFITSQRITEELTSFFNQTSDFEGIESQHAELHQEEKIDFDSNQFVDCLEKMIRILNTGHKEESDSESSGDDLDNMCYNDHINDDCDKELEAKLNNTSTGNLKDDKNVLMNIIQSMKEEKASTGPSSNIMRSLGVSKTDLLDSDDD